VRDLPPPAPTSRAVAAPTPTSSALTAPPTTETAVAIPSEVHHVPQGQIPYGEIRDEATDEPIRVVGGHAYPSGPGVSLSQNDPQGGITEKGFDELLHTLPNKYAEEKAKISHGLVEYRQSAGIAERIAPPAPGSALSALAPISYVKPEWHAPWKLMRVISGHTGWVRSISVDKSNEWFITGSADRTIKVWDLATGVLKLTLTGHINTVRGLAVSPRHPYLFSCGEDKQIKCWDLEYNKVIRQYHGHLSAVYCLALHPTIDVMITGGRDMTARVWDMRTKQNVFVLGGHQNTVCAVAAQGADPQVITGSHDSTIRLWDLSTGKTAATLTNHKKSVRALVLHPSEFSFCSGAPDNLKVWKCPDGNFLRNISGHNAIINTLAVNQDDVLVSAADNGTMQFWDWKTGYCFQNYTTTPQPGSLDSEAGIYALMFDHTGSRLFACEADKTIKVYKEDEEATPETHPVVNWRPSRNKKRY
jgi:pleiotropic regulator 1